MSAEILRRAAKKMRERAESATHHSPPPWTAHEGTYGDPANGPTDMRVSDRTRTAVAITDHCLAGCQNAEHIASWHPAVALAVADWLDTAGADLWAHGPLCACGSGCHDCDDDLWQPHVRRALAVARTYLGSDA